MNTFYSNCFTKHTKRIFTVCTGLLLYSSAIAQQSSASAAHTPVYSKYSFTDTVRMTNIPAEELYSRAWKWFEEQSKTDPNMLEEANNRKMYFIGTSGFHFQSKNKAGNEFVKGKIYYLVKIHIHEGYYVYEFTDFIHQGRITFNTLTDSPKYPYRPLADREWHNIIWKELKENVRENIYPIIGSLRASMQIQTEKFTEIVARRSNELSLEELHKAVIVPVKTPAKPSASARQPKKLEGASGKETGSSTRK